MSKQYIHSGICIWCKRGEPVVSFKRAPHIVPKAIGATEIGFDVCDECNHYFGTATKEFPYNMDLVFKEVFNTIQYALSGIIKVNKSYSSAYFHFNPAKRKFKLKRAISYADFTSAFKRSLYEVFLQKYHYTFPDDSLEQFEHIRNYARYGVGHMNVFFLLNETVLISQICEDNVWLPMPTDCRDKIFSTGYFVFLYMGQILFFEIIPELARANGFDGLYQVASDYILSKNTWIQPLNDFRELDLFLNRLR